MNVDFQPTKCSALRWIVGSCSTFVQDFTNPCHGLMGRHNPSLEELTTILCRIEAILNSRPLTPISSSPLDLDYLSPGHFLIGQPLLAVPNIIYPTTTGKLSTAGSCFISPISRFGTDGPVNTYVHYRTEQNVQTMFQTSKTETWS